MAIHAPAQDSSSPGLCPVLWGVASALTAAAVVWLAAAGWFTLRGYPDHAQRLVIPLVSFDVAAGEVEETEAGTRLVPDERGVVIALFGSAPRFPAFQFTEITIKVVDATPSRGAKLLWATRQAPQETRSLPLKRDGKILSATLDESPEWTDRVNGIGIAIMDEDPTEIASIILRPPEPTFAYFLTRIWHEWTYQEAYHGYTINGLKGAGRATLIPNTLAGGFALLFAGSICLLLSLGANWRIPRQPALIAAIVTLWSLTAYPWIHEVWGETLWSVETYAGKTDAERRLAEPDGYLFAIAQKVKETLPPPPERIVVVSSGGTPPGSTNYERTKIHYYLAPYNVLSINRNLPKPGKKTVSRGNYVLVLDEEHPSYNGTKGRIHPGYPVRLMLEYKGARLYKVSADD